ncbi:hypothetical protein NUACC21_28350 [Scytonema sp. NUACC21]
MAPIGYFQRQYRLRSSTVFLCSISVALGFTAEENWIYLYHGFQGTASILERLISTPVHAMFSAPWGYALGMFIGSNIHSNQLKRQVLKAWFNSVVCHALVNVLSLSGRYPLPLRFLSYGLFPFLLWMFWRLEQLLQRVQGQNPVTLISGRAFKLRLWKWVLTLFTLMFGGHAIFVLFALARDLSFLNVSQLFYTEVALSILNRLCFSLILGFLARAIYRHLRRLASRRRYF